MVPQYDDDDIIENYDEVTTSAEQSPARKVSSAQGGPVQRPTKQVKPSDRLRAPSTRSPTAVVAPAGGEVPPQGDAASNEPPRPKGQISAKQAKLIWIICIGICVLGAAAVGAHYIFVVLPAKQNVAQNNEPVRNRPVQTPPREKTPHEKNVEFFMGMLAKHRNDLYRSRGWDEFRYATIMMEDKRDKAFASKSQAGSSQAEQDQLWAESIHWFYTAMYWSQVFQQAYVPDGMGSIQIEGLRQLDPSDFNAVASLTDDELKNEQIQRFVAAFMILGNSISNVKKFRTDVIKNELRAQFVHSDSPEHKKIFQQAKDLSSAAEQDPPAFDEKDLEYAKGPAFETIGDMKWNKLQIQLDNEKKGGG
ncbi:MAG: hypothetical protein IT463_07470 [Planctomycetes bacterium]|nr:hypothetical protein [Planctomycetota bacterium]